MTDRYNCFDCGKPLGQINWKELKLKKTDQVRCQPCALKEFED